MLNTPTSLAAGKPVRAPLAGLKLSQAGLLLMLKLSVSPSGSEAVGTKLKTCSSITDAGVPLITGAVLGLAATLILMVSELLKSPSETLSTILS